MGRGGQKTAGSGTVNMNSDGKVAQSPSSCGSPVAKGSPSMGNTINIRNVATPSRSAAGTGAGSDRRGGGSTEGNANRNQNGQLEDIMRRKGVDEAWTALENMQQQGVISDKYTVSRMLMKTVGDGRAHLNVTRVYRSIGIVEKFIDTQPKDVDEVLFNALLDTCCRLKDLSRLETTVNRMRELKVTPSPVTLGILVKTYGKAGNLPKVLEVWDEMEKQRGQANAVTFGCMIDACVKCGNLAKAVEIFEGMRKEGKHRNTILYTTLIKGYGLEKDLKSALALFREMPSENVPCNTITFNSIIDACVKCQDLQTAEQLLSEIKSPTCQLEPDLITFSTLLKGYCYIGDLDKALAIAETIKDRGLRSDELVYNTLMDGCVKAGDVAAGLGLFEEMVSLGMRPSAITHGILVRLHLKAGGPEEKSTEAVGQLFQQHGLDRPGGDRQRGGGYGRNKYGNQRTPVNGQSPDQSPTHSEYGTPHAASASPMGVQSFGLIGGSTPNQSDVQPWWGEVPAMPYNNMMPSESSPQSSPYLADATRSHVVPPFPGSPVDQPQYGNGSMLQSGALGAPPRSPQFYQQQQPQEQQLALQQQQQQPFQSLPFFPFVSGPPLCPNGYQLQTGQSYSATGVSSYPLGSSGPMPQLPPAGSTATEFAGTSPVAATACLNLYPEAYFENWSATMAAPSNNFISHN